MVVKTISSESLLAKLIFRNSLKHVVTCNINMDILRQPACFDVNTLIVDNFASLFKCMARGGPHTKLLLISHSVQMACTCLSINVKKIAFGNKEHTTD